MSARAGGWKGSVRESQYTTESVSLIIAARSSAGEMRASAFTIDRVAYYGQVSQICHSARRPGDEICSSDARPHQASTRARARPVFLLRAKGARHHHGRLVGGLLLLSCLTQRQLVASYRTFFSGPFRARACVYQRAHSLPFRDLARQYMFVRGSSFVARTPLPFRPGCYRSNARHNYAASPA